jgi:uncharacterized membrane protein SirB2
MKMKPLEAINRDVFWINEKTRRKQRYKNQIRQWATPFTIGAFLLTAVTGILLFFKINFGLVKPAHEWLSCLLILGSAFHLYVNWGSSIHAFSSPAGKRIFALLLLLSCIAILSLSSATSEKHASNWLADALAQAPLSAVTQLAHHDADAMVTILRAQGINLMSTDQTIQEIAEENNRQAMEVLALLF